MSPSLPVPDGGAVDVYFLDVGQGDCTLIVDGDTHSAILIDCPAGRERIVEQHLRALGIDTLHAAILTHWDLDHYGGFLSVVGSVGCKELYYNRDSMMIIDDSPNMRRSALLEILESPFDQFEHRAADDRITGSMGRVEWQLLSPDHLR